MIETKVTNLFTHARLKIYKIHKELSPLVQKLMRYRTILRKTLPYSLIDYQTIQYVVDIFLTKSLSVTKNIIINNIYYYNL